MSISPASEPLPSISRSEFLSSLPRWRRWLAMLNWHPVVDYEIREIEFEQRRIAHEQRMRQLENEAKQRQSEFEQREIAHEQRMQQLENEIVQLRNENAREAELNARIAALWPSSTSSSTQQTPPPEPGSPT